MMELCMWSGYYGNLSPEDAVKRFVSRGWKYLEFSSEHAAALLERGNPETIGKEFRRFADEAGAFLPQGHLWLKCDIAAPDQDVVLDQLKGWIDLFQSIGITYAVLHAGGTQLQEQGCEPQKIHEARIRALSIITQYIKDSEMVICLENTVKHTPDADSLINLIECTGSPRLGICLDTGHLNRAGGSQREFILKAKPYLKALHINDNEGVTDQHMMPYGRGKINWVEVMTALKEINYTEVFNLEVPGETGRIPTAVRDIKLDYIKTLCTMMLNESIGGY